MTDTRKGSKALEKVFDDEADGFTAISNTKRCGCLESSNKLPSDLARQRGVRRNQLYKWKGQLSRRGAQAFQDTDDALRGHVSH